MEQYRPTVGIEPTDKYEKAKQDLITAYNSFRELSPNQQVMLAKELLGAANVTAMLNVMQRAFWNYQDYSMKSIFAGAFRCELKTNNPAEESVIELLKSTL